MSVQFNPERHEYSVDGRVIPSVTQILKDIGVIETRWYTAEGRNRGSTVHEYLELYDRGLLDPNVVEPEYRGYIDAYLDFLACSKVEYEQIEEPVAHPVYKFAGTPDRVGKINDTACVLDIKSGSSVDWHGLQLAGYALALGNGHDLYALYIKEDGKWTTKTWDAREYQKIFLSYVIGWWYIERRVKK